MKFLLRMLISALAIFAVQYVSNGALLSVDSFWPSAVVAALVLALVNAIVRPVVQVLALPINVVTLGLFSLVVNAAMLYLVAAVVPGVRTHGFWATLLAALVIAVVNSIGSSMIDSD